MLERKDAVKALSNAKNSKDFLMILSSFSNVAFVPGKTVIFIDEIQEAKEVDIVTMSSYGIGIVSFGGIVCCILAAAAAFVGVFLSIKALRILAVNIGFNI